MKNQYPLPERKNEIFPKSETTRKNRTESLILITGTKHSGKTLCARALEKQSGIKAVDIDEVIERESGKTPRALFIESVELFRKAEAAALADLFLPENKNEAKTDLQQKQSRQRRIIAAGGGLIDNPKALALLDQHREITIVYLDVSPETAWQRINNEANGELPPFLKTDNPKETHFTLHKRRAAEYKKLAHYCIQAENKSPEELAAEIIKILEL